MLSPFVWCHLLRVLVLNLNCNSNRIVGKQTRLHQNKAADIT